MFTTVKSAVANVINFSQPTAAEQAEYLAKVLIADTPTGIKAAGFASEEVTTKAAALLARSDSVEQVLRHDLCPKWFKALLTDALEDLGQIILS
jgi:phage tail sheath protein FI